MKALIVIPSRFASTRFPGKPLLNIEGKSLIQRTWLQANKVKGDNTVVVATDDKEIFAHVESFGGKAIMTSVDHFSGTDRCFEAAHIINTEFDILVNLQGDEPFIQPSQIESLINLFDGNTQIATLKKKLETGEDIFNENYVKVVCDNRNNALLFSRQALPFQRGVEKTLWQQNHNYYRHLGIYAFSSSVINSLKTLTPSPLEKAEMLEQLRWLESGFKIKVAETDFQSPAIDSPEDLNAVKLFLEQNPDFI